MNRTMHALTLAALTIASMAAGPQLVEHEVTGGAFCDTPGLGRPYCQAMPGQTCLKRYDKCKPSAGPPFDDNICLIDGGAQSVCGNPTICQDGHDDALNPTCESVP